MWGLFYVLIVENIVIRKRELFYVLIVENIVIRKRELASFEGYCNNPNFKYNIKSTYLKTTKIWFGKKRGLHHKQK